MIARRLERAAVSKRPSTVLNAKAIDFAVCPAKFDIFRCGPQIPDECGTWTIRHQS